jgi:hypothetical protein
MGLVLTDVYFKSRSLGLLITPAVAAALFDDFGNTVFRVARQRAGPRNFE